MNRSATVATLVFLASTAYAQPAQAGRVVSFEILVDGKIVMAAQTLDEGEGFDTAWNYLKKLPVEKLRDQIGVSAEEAARRKAFQPEVNKKDPRKATIKGKCRIFCRYAGDITIDEIRLVRENEKSPWIIDPKQVDEMAKKRTIDPKKRTRAQVDQATQKKD